MRTRADEAWSEYRPLNAGDQPSVVSYSINNDLHTSPLSIARVHFTIQTMGPSHAYRRSHTVTASYPGKKASHVSRIGSVS